MHKAVHRTRINQTLDINIQSTFCPNSHQVGAVRCIDVRKYAHNFFIRPQLFFRGLPLAARKNTTTWGTNWTVSCVSGISWQSGTINQGIHTYMALKFAITKILFVCFLLFQNILPPGSTQCPPWSLACYRCNPLHLSPHTNSITTVGQSFSSYLKIPGWCHELPSGQFSD